LQHEISLTNRAETNIAWWNSCPAAPQADQKLNIFIMKSILYVGATLMVGASIYGFIDYKNTMNKQEFTRMYEGKPPAGSIQPAKAYSVPETKEPLVEEKKNFKSRKATAKKKEEEMVDVKFATEEFVAPVEIKENVPVEAETFAEVKESKVETKEAPAKSKKLNRKMFSRGSMERYEPKELKADTTAATTGKSKKWL
jgi:hypothetical protein